MSLETKHSEFNNSDRKHILLITNHGCHSPVISITTDTGGQNIYINNFCFALLEYNHKITILNRGGFEHPVTSESQRGIEYYEDVWDEVGKYCRIIYLEDDINEFICKEELDLINLEKERDFFFKFAKEINFDFKNIDFVSSHYWDGGILSLLILEEINKQYNITIPHLWTPHSLGRLKMKNYEGTPEEEIKFFKFPERFEFEEQVISQVDGVVSTSKTISDTFLEYEARAKNNLWCPPGVYITEFKPRSIKECTDGLNVLKKVKGLEIEDLIKLLRDKTVILEASRTAKTKQKDLIMKAFSMIKNKEKALLIINVDKKSSLYESILKTSKELKNDNIFLINRIISNEEMAQLFSLADIYVTASLMEGWGIAVLEAAVSKCAIISSKYVPFILEVIKENAIIINDDEITSYAEKMDLLIDNEQLRTNLAEKSYQIAKDDYTWFGLVKNLLAELKKKNIIP